VARALGYAHESGVVHRDVKAENILVEGTSGRAMVTDFGIARLAEAAPLTATGTVLGTVHYMSPEQVAGDAVDPRSDIYSLGVVAFFALSGRFPFESPIASAVLVAHVTRAAPALASVAPAVPAELASLIDRCLAKDPDERFQSCDELISALERVEELLPHDAPPVPRPVAAISSTEAQEVWRRAAELQDMTGKLPPVRLPADGQTPPRRSAPLTSGFQVEQVRAAAEEAGIGGPFVERALLERGHLAAVPEQTIVREGVLPAYNPWLGARSTISYEAIVPGEMPERDFDLLVDSIRRALNDAGVVSQVGRSLTWTSADKSRRIQATVLVRDGRTTIHVSERLRDLAGGLFGGIVGGGGGGTAGPVIGVALDALHMPWLLPALLTGTVGTAYLIARTIFRRISRSRQSVLRQLTERMAEEARDSIARRSFGPAHRNERKQLRS
jgi:serine/threonine-protein kinase